MVGNCGQRHRPQWFLSNLYGTENRTNIISIEYNAMVKRTAARNSQRDIDHNDQASIFCLVSRPSEASVLSLLVRD
jgi:hypothetical protein